MNKNIDIEEAKEGFTIVLLILLNANNLPVFLYKQLKVRLSMFTIDNNYNNKPYKRCSVDRPF